METYYTIEEKYLQAVEEYYYGETAKSLQLFTEIVTEDPLYARAHYQLGDIYYKESHDYQSAGYHYKLCTELEPNFPDAYVPYLRLLVFLNRKAMVESVSAKAMLVPGVNASKVYHLQGQCAEKNGDLITAATLYRQALMAAYDKEQFSAMEEHLERIKQKQQSARAYVYDLA